MTSRASKLVLAAVLASSVPATAFAGDCDHDRDRGYPPAAYPAYPSHPAPAPRHWREASWRERELASAGTRTR